MATKNNPKQSKPRQSVSKKTGGRPKRLAIEQKNNIRALLARGIADDVIIKKFRLSPIVWSDLKVEYLRIISLSKTQGPEAVRRGFGVPPGLLAYMSSRRQDEKAPAVITDLPKPTVFSLPRSRIPVQDAYLKIKNGYKNLNPIERSKELQKVQTELGKDLAKGMPNKQKVSELMHCEISRMNRFEIF